MVFSNESALHAKQPKYWSFSFGIGPSNEYSGLISFRIDWFDLLQSKGLSRVFFSTAIQKHLSLLYGPALTSVHYYCLTFKKTKDRIRSNMLTNSNKHFKKWPIQKNLKKSIFTILCNYSCYLIPDRFQKPHKETLYLLACTSHSTTPPPMPLSPPLELYSTFCLLDFSVLEISYKRIHTLCRFLSRSVSSSSIYLVACITTSLLFMG